MRNGTSNRRARGRNNRNNKGGMNRATVYDSNGPDVRIRGTAFQICEKYEALAKDARAIGDTVMAESYLQHAEHYQRIISEINAQTAAKQEVQREQKTFEAKQPVQAQSVQNQREEEANSNEDLSLPASILGASVHVPVEPVREMAKA